MGRDVIIACDFNSKEEVVSFLSKFQDEKPFAKIGMELFYAEGRIYFSAITTFLYNRGDENFFR